MTALLSFLAHAATLTAGSEFTVEPFGHRRTMWLVRWEDASGTHATVMFASDLRGAA